MMRSQNGRRDEPSHAHGPSPEFQATDEVNAIAGEDVLVIRLDEEDIKERKECSAEELKQMEQLES